MRTGTRCTTFSQLPVAFCAGSSEKAPPGAGREADHPAVVDHAAAVDVGGQFRRLADAHLAQLGFLEVGIDPDLLQRHDGHQRRAGCGALAELGAAPRHLAGDRRRHAAAAQRQPGVAHFRRRAQHAGMVRDGGVVDQHAVGLGLAAGAGELRLHFLQGVAGVLEFLGRDGAGAGELLASGEVLFGARQGCLAGRDDGVEGTVRAEQRCHFPHRLREFGFGLLQREAGVGVVDFDQCLTGLDEIGVVGVDGDDGAGDLRRHLDDVAGDIGVVGVHLEAADAVPPDGVGAAEAEEADCGGRAAASGACCCGGVAAAGSAGGFIGPILGCG